MHCNDLPVDVDPPMSPALCFEVKQATCKKPVRFGLKFVVLVESVLQWPVLRRLFVASWSSHNQLAISFLRTGSIVPQNYLEIDFVL